jgi:hypothetical protein
MRRRHSEQRSRLLVVLFGLGRSLLRTGPRRTVHLGRLEQRSWRDKISRVCNRRRFIVQFHSLFLSAAGQAPQPHIPGESKAYTGDRAPRRCRQGGYRGRGRQEEQGSESVVVHPGALGRAGLGRSGLQNLPESLRSSPLAEKNRYSLCIGTFGSIPINCELDRSLQWGFDGPGSPSPNSEVCIANTASAATGEGSARREFDLQKRGDSSEEKENEASSVSAVCRGSSSKQVDPRNVGTDSGGLRSVQEGQEGCFNSAGFKSPSSASGEDSRGVSVSNLRQSSRVNESRVLVAEVTATSSGRVGMSSPSQGCTLVDEVESFFQQLWHIPWDLAKGCPRAATIKHPRPSAVRVPKPPPPLLPQERSGLCCLGVEEEGFVEEPAMAERGRGRGRGGTGRGEWQANQQQPPPQQQMFDFNQMQ